MQAMRRSGGVGVAAPSLPQVSWPHLHWLALPNRGLTELSLIQELIRRIVQEQGGHFISSLLWVLPALCSLHQPRPLAWALDIKLPVAAGNLPERTFPFTTRLTGLGPSLPPHMPPCVWMCTAVVRSECSSLPASGDLSTGETFREPRSPRPQAPSLLLTRLLEQPHFD